MRIIKSIRLVMVTTLLQSVVILSAMAEEGTQIAVGLLAELSGPDAANGKACHDGYRAAEYWYSRDQSLGSKVRLIYGDHRGDSRTALNEFTKLVSQEKVSAVISNRGHIGAVLDPVSARKGVPLLGIMGHADFIERNPYGFRVWVSPTRDGGALADIAFKQGFRRAAMLVLQDDYIVTVASEFKRAFLMRGGTLSYEDSIDRGESDFSAIVARIKYSKPDLLFVTGALSQLGLIVRRMREHGLTQQIISNFWIGYQDVIDTAGVNNIEGALYVSLDLNLLNFKKALAKVNPQADGHLVTYACFSALTAVYNAVQDFPDIRDKESLYQTLLNMPELRLPDERVKWHGRELFYNLVPYRIVAGVPTVQPELQ